jgi:Uma2 family endonuclease
MGYTGRMAKTIEDFLSLPEGTLAELIDGEILMSPAPRESHQNAVGNLHAELRAFVHARKLGRVFLSPFDVHLPSGAVVEPDLVFVSTARSRIVQDWVRGAPDLLVEVVSPDSARRDRVRKRALYAENGVSEYWIVDPAEESVEVLFLKAGAYESAGTFRADDAVASPLLAGLELPARRVFARP